VLLVRLPNSDYATLVEKAERLRETGSNVEIYHDPDKKVGQQIQYANRKGIRYALFANATNDEMKDLISGTQTQVSIGTWLPDRSASYQTRIVPASKLATSRRPR
jgi:histidyl-tRNA synthetase